MSMAAQKKNLLILFFVFQDNEILWCLRNKDIFKGFHFASGITCKGLHCKPVLSHFSRMSAFSYRIPTLGDIE